MKTLIRTLALALLGIASTASHAQVACPPGTMPYGTGQGLSFCGPMPDTNEQAPQWQALPVKWASRWGAVATDGNRGSLGVATDVSSQSAAEKLAMQNCKDKGGAQCVLDVSYGNSCVAMLVGERGYSVKTGRTTEEAIAFATKSCSAFDKNCRVYYTNCSLAIRTQ